jgi:hypothetical protein
MFTKEYVREVLTQMVAPYMEAPLSDEFVDRIYDGFVKIRNGEAVEHSVQRTGCPVCKESLDKDGWCVRCGEYPFETANR